MTRFPPVLATLLAANLLAACHATDSTPDGPTDPIGEGLVQPSDFQYLGRFALPTDQHGDSWFNYGGQALTYYKDPVSGKETLFMEGHAWYPGNVAQVEIPTTLGTGAWNTLPMAGVLQPFADITDGKFSTVGNYTTFVYGMLGYHGRLIVAASEYYDADGSQVNSHAVSSFDLSSGGDLAGFYPFAAQASPRSLGGWMTPIPPEWQDSLGGPALTGQCCLSIISTSSAGPSVTVFDPDDVGVQDPIPGATLLFYPLSHPLAVETSQNQFYNLATQIGGMAFPPGTSSLLFIGRHGTGPYCYGTGAECNDPVDGSKGTHSYPYRHQVWAYDVNDFLAVKNGQQEAWDPRPYAIWTLTDMDTGGGATVAGVAYDPTSGRLFIAERFGDFPLIHVYRIN